MKWFLQWLSSQDEFPMFLVFFLIVTAGFGVGAMVERHQHNSCVVEMAKAGKTVEEAKGVCK